MIYYSTGKGSYMRSVGKAVDIDEATAEILIKKGFIVESKDQLQLKKDMVVEVIPTVQKPVEIIAPPKKKGNPNWGRR